MAWRLNEMVTQGVIDNRQKGKVIGMLWLIGQESAVRLELDGNCAGDLAGCLVEFVNHNPRPDPSIGRFRDQVGTARHDHGLAESTDVASRCSSRGANP
jgi:hypothetical protein